MVSSIAKPHNRLLRVRDFTSGLQFLVDTGAMMSLFPPTKHEKQSTPTFDLLAANETPIATYGQRYGVLDLGLGRKFEWIFRVAEVRQPILGWDFLQHFGLSIDSVRGALVDPSTEQQVLGVPCTELTPGLALNLVQDSDTCAYGKILKEFPNLTCPQQASPPRKHSVVHEIPSAHLFSPLKITS